MIQRILSVYLMLFLVMAGMVPPAPVIAQDTRDYTIAVLNLDAKGVSQVEAEVLSAVAKALLQVKPQHRRVLVLRINHSLSNTEIAERENIPLATVGTWLRRGREELREMLRPLLRDMQGNRS